MTRQVTLNSSMRPHVLFAALLFAVSALLPASPAFADDPNGLENRLRKEAPRGWKTLLEWASTVHCVGRLSELNSRSQPGKPQLLHTVHYRRSGKSVLAEAESAGDQGGRAVYCTNPTYSFLVSAKNDKSSPWVLRGLHQSAAKNVVATDITENFERFTLACLMVGVSHQLLPDLLGDPTFSIVNVEPKHSGSGEHVKVTFTLSVPPNVSTPEQNAKPIDVSGWMVLDPTNHWCLVEHELVGRLKFHTRITYAADPIGQCRPVHRVECTRTAPGTAGSHFVKEIFDVTTAEQATFPADTFLLTAFGLPEPVAAPRASRSRLWLWLLLGAALTGAGGLYLRSRSRTSD